MAKQTAYEAKKGLVPRAELEGNIVGLMKDLDDEEFHCFYSLVWHMSARAMLMRMKGDK